MKKLGILLALSLAFPLAALKEKDKDKHKEKSFTPVEISAPQAAGRYVGIDPDYIVELTPTGGTLHDQQGTVALTNVVIEGSQLRATAGDRPFRATFVNRTLNGATAFGLLVHDSNVRLDGDVILGDLFCRRQ
jgi:hypothetical protein